MTGKSIFSLKERSFASYLLVVMLILVIIVVGLVVVNNYFNTQKIFEKNSQHIKQQTEQSIIITVKLTDEIYNLYDSSLNEQMRRGFDAVLAEYERAGRTPSRMNLTEVKHELGEQFDIYIINEYGVIEFTTYAPERGLDFKAVPYFFTYLTKIRNSEGFFPDRIVGEELGNGTLRKYAYMPTPDHRYVLELGLAQPSLSGERSSIQYTKSIEKIASFNPYIKRVRIFNSMGDIAENNSEVVDALTQNTLKKVLEQREGFTVTFPETGQSVKYLFIDLKNEQYGSDASRIVEILSLIHI